MGKAPDRRPTSLMNVIAVVTACVFMITTACSTAPKGGIGSRSSASCDVGGDSPPSDGEISSSDATFSYHVDGTSSVFDASTFGAFFYHAETHVTPDVTTTTVLFGRTFFPVGEVTIQSTDGQTMSGTIDGRPLAPFAKGQPWETVQMADGSPLPPMDPDPRARDALDALLRTAQGGGSACAVAGAAKGETKIESNNYLAPGHLSTTGFGYAPCDICIAACGGAFIACGIAAAIAALSCLVFYGACLAAGLLACGIAFLSCGTVCGFPGNPCCPVSCGGGGCCQSGESCLKPPSPLCCSAGTKPCNGTTSDNCCNNADACLPDGSCCANGNPICLGNTCCNPGDNCASAGQESGDPKDPCCPAKQVVCNNTCCKPGELCIKGMAGPDHCGTCPPDPTIPGSGLCSDQYQCCNASTFPGTACAKFGPKPLNCCLPKTICDVGGTPCCQGNQTCTGSPLKATCCDDKNVCGANAETCCTDPINPCSKSDATGSPVCCDTSVHQFCPVSGKCCDKPGSTCNAAGDCVP